MRVLLFQPRDRRRVGRSCERVLYIHYSRAKRSGPAFLIRNLNCFIYSGVGTYQLITVDVPFKGIARRGGFPHTPLHMLATAFIYSFADGFITPRYVICAKTLWAASTTHERKYTSAVNGDTYKRVREVLRLRRRVVDAAHILPPSLKTNPTETGLFLQRVGAPYTPRVRSSSRATPTQLIFEVQA